MVDRNGSTGHQDTGSPSRRERATERLGGAALLAAAIVMALGAALKRVAGADLDRALAEGDVAGYLALAADQQGLLVANLAAWIVGVLLFGLAATAIADRCTRRPTWGRVGRYCYGTGVPLAVGSFVAWLVLVVRLDPGMGRQALAVAEALGWWASRTDWIATVLVVGAGPLVFSLAGQDDWAPRWLAWLGALAGLAGLATVLALFTGALGTYGMAIVPVGLLWSLAAGVHLLRGGSGSGGAEA